MEERFPKKQPWCFGKYGGIKCTAADQYPSIHSWLACGWATDCKEKTK